MKYANIIINSFEAISAHAIVSHVEWLKSADYLHTHYQKKREVEKAFNTFTPAIVAEAWEARISYNEDQKCKLPSYIMSLVCFPPIERVKHPISHNFILSIWGMDGISYREARERLHVLEERMKEAEQKHKNRDLFYTSFDWNGKVYKRSRIDRTLAEEKARTMKKAMVTEDGEFLEVPDFSRPVFAPKDGHFSDNAFLQYAIANSLAERIVHKALYRIFTGFVNKKTGELQGGKLDALFLLWGREYPVSIEDYTQALYAHFVEKAYSGEYTMACSLETHEEVALFDIRACFRLIWGMMYSNNAVHGRVYKTIMSSLEAMQDEGIDWAYLDNSFELLDMGLLLGLRNYTLKSGGTLAIYATLKDYCLGLISGYSKGHIAEALGYTTQGINKLVRKYLRPYLEREYNVPQKPEKTDDKLGFGDYVGLMKA